MGGRLDLDKLAEAPDSSSVEVYKVRDYLLRVV